MELSLVIITGVSGAGKLTALNACEDLGYYCVNNLPAQLLGSFTDFVVKDVSHGGKFALVLDVRSEKSLKDLNLFLDPLKQKGAKIHILFLDCHEQALIKRYQETRRPHPLTVSNESVKDVVTSIEEERSMLASVRELATHILDTSSFTPHDLKQVIGEFLKKEKELKIVFKSFGFKYGVPLDANLLLDVRFLPNPHFVDSLKRLTGVEPEVSSYVFQDRDSKLLVEKFQNMLEFLIPNYKKEGKSLLTIAIGCTGGKHRSVAIVESISKSLNYPKNLIKISHRDISL